MRALVEDAIEELCRAFAEHGYNPTPIIDLGVLVASADGKVDGRERSMLAEVFQALLETALPVYVVDHLVTASLDIIEAAGAESRARLVGEILQDCVAGEPGVKVALAIAFASEGLSEKEKLVVERIGRAAGLTPDRVAALTEEVREYAEDPVSIRDALRTTASTPKP
jgi:tellurite resistance protein